MITVNSYVCLQRVLVESSVHMGNDWFWRAVLPLTSGAFGIEREWLIHVGPLMSRPAAYGVERLHCEWLILYRRHFRAAVPVLFGAREALMCDETR